LNGPPASSSVEFNGTLETRNLKLETFFYQDDFETPGISPLSASERKHKRQMPNFRRKARGRPHSLQRLCRRLENLGFLASLTRFAVVAISSFDYCLNGMPRCFSSERASLSLWAVVTMVTFMPFVLSTFA
jgi:hypothetical protein